MNMIIVLAVSSAAVGVAAAPAGLPVSIRLDVPVVCDPQTDAVFQYDDGSASWLTWGGLYRGVWFDLEDFVPGAAGGEISALEFWFFHHSSCPWDTACFYAEVYGGDQSGPATLLAQVSATASHMGPDYVYFDPPLQVPSDFWVVVNTEMSSGGWPCILGDPSATAGPHSFFSDDFVVWEPWGIGDYFIRAHGEALLDLESTTWGAVKSLFLP